MNKQNKRLRDSFLALLGIFAFVGYMMACCVFAQWSRSH